MSVWLTEKEFRQSGAQSTGVTLNVAFLRDIKDDNPSILSQTSHLCGEFSEGRVSPRQAVENLVQYRDALETYFALEEFYGYFKNAPVSNPVISTRANELRSEHERLFLILNRVVDLAEQIMYHECPSNTTLNEVSELFRNFAEQFQSHEQNEMELMMRLCNEELGVGD